MRLRANQTVKVTRGAAVPEYCCRQAATSSKNHRRVSTVGTLNRTAAFAWKLSNERFVATMHGNRNQTPTRCGNSVLHCAPTVASRTPNGDGTAHRPLSRSFVGQCYAASSQPGAAPPRSQLWSLVSSLPRAPPMQSSHCPIIPCLYNPQFGIAIDTGT